MDAMTQITKFDDIKSVFSQIGVVARKGTPLKLEFGLMIQNRVVTYHAADRKSLSEIPGRELKHLMFQLSLSAHFFLLVFENFSYPEDHSASKQVI